MWQNRIGNPLRARNEIGVRASLPPCLLLPPPDERVDECLVLPQGWDHLGEGSRS